MGQTSKFVSTIFRIMELISASIVAGVLGTYLHYVSQARATKSGRVVYTISIAGISIFFSLVLILPMTYSFFAFPFDFAMFVCWMVAFGLLVNLVGGAGCHSTWYWSNWGYFWGRWYRVVPVSGVTESEVGTSACGRWRAALAWSFIGGMFWLLSFALGIYALSRDRSKKRTPSTDAIRHEENHMASGVEHNKEQGYMASGVEPSLANREQVNRQEGAVQNEQHGMTCTQCQAVIKPGNRFCNSCGSPQASPQFAKETV